MNKNVTIAGFLLFFVVLAVFTQGRGSLKEQIVTGLDGILNNPTWKLENLDTWDDDEAISRINFMITKTTSSLTSLIPNLKPSEQREVYALYSDLLRFPNDLDFEFQVLQVLRSLCEKHPSLKSRPLLWVFSSRASAQLSEVVSGEVGEQKTE